MRLLAQTVLLICLFCSLASSATAGQTRGRVGYQVRVGRKVVMRVTQTESTQTLQITGTSNLIVSTAKPGTGDGLQGQADEQLVIAGRDWRLQVPADSADVVVVTISSAD